MQKNCYNISQIVNKMNNNFKQKKTLKKTIPGPFSSYEKEQIKKNSKILTDPVKEKAFVDYLKYLADK